MEKRKTKDLIILKLNYSSVWTEWFFCFLFVFNICEEATKCTSYNLIYIYMYMYINILDYIQHKHVLCCPQPLSHVQLFANLWTVACQAPLFMLFSRQEYWSGQPFPSPEDLPNPGIEPRSPVLQVDSLPAELLGKSNISIDIHNMNVYLSIYICQAFHQISPLSDLLRTLNISQLL